MSSSDILVTIDEFYVGNRNYRLRRPRAFVVRVSTWSLRTSFVIDCPEFGFVAGGHSIQQALEDFHAWIDGAWHIYAEASEDTLDGQAAQLRLTLLNAFEMTEAYREERK